MPLMTCFWKTTGCKSRKAEMKFGFWPPCTVYINNDRVCVCLFSSLLGWWTQEQQRLMWFWVVMCLNDSGKGGNGIILNLNHLFRNAQNIAVNIQSEYTWFFNFTNIRNKIQNILFIKYKIYTYCTVTMDLHWKAPSD